MKRVLAGAVLGMAALGGVASAAEYVRVYPHVTTDDGVGVGVGYSTMSRDEEPLGGARYNATNGTVCVGFSYQVPQCVGGPQN